MNESVYLSLGSNLGDRVATLKEAIARIAEIPETQVCAVSSVYDTVPAYHDDQPEFANMVIRVDTGLDPVELFTRLTMIESDLGRRREFPNSPRTLDIDILLYGDQVIETDLLTVPHRGMRERDFVVTPMSEIAPGLVLPDGRPLDPEEVKVGQCTGVLADASSIPLTCYTSVPS